MVTNRQPDCLLAIAAQRDAEGRHEEADQWRECAMRFANGESAAGRQAEEFGRVAVGVVTTAALAYFLFEPVIMLLCEFCQIAARWLS